MTKLSFEDGSDTESVKSILHKNNDKRINMGKKTNNIDEQGKRCNMSDNREQEAKIQPTMVQGPDCTRIYDMSVFKEVKENQSESPYRCNAIRRREMSRTMADLQEMATKQSNIELSKEDLSESSCIILSSEESSEIEIKEVKMIKIPRNEFNLRDAINRVDILNVNGIRITKNDLCRLLPGVWLNDKLINAYMTLLATKFSRVKFYNTYFLESATLGGQTDSNKTRCNVDYAKERRDLRKYEMAVFPIHSNAHWIMARFQRNVLYVYDSLDTNCYREIYTLRRILENITGNKINTASPAAFKETEPIPKQFNGSDCGVFLCMYSKKIAGDYAFYNGDMNEYRKRICHELVECRILYSHKKK